MKRNHRRLLIGISIVLTVLLLVAGGTLWAFIHRFYPSPPAASFPAAADVTTAQTQDLTYFEHYLALEQAYTPQARAEAQRLLQGYRAQADRLSASQFDLAIARMAALADNGHSRVSYWRLLLKHNRLPCRLYHFADGYRVIRARGACQELLGARLEGMDGHPIEQIADTLYAYVRGPRNHYDQFASPFFLESPELLAAAGMAAAADRVSLQVRRLDGTQSTVEMPADPPDPNLPHEFAWAFADQYLSPEPIAREPAGWQPLLARDARLPVFLKDYKVPFRTEYWPDKHVYYMQMRSNSDEPGYPISTFLSRVKREITQDQPHFVVLDLRLNQGGNLTTTGSFMRKLTTLAGSIEHVYVLISAWTFSAGEASAAMVRAHGGNKVTLIGETVGDRTRFWAEGGSLTLPNSKVELHYSTGLHDYRQACWGQNRCFWPLYFFPTGVRNMDPDVPVAYSFEDYRALKDPMLEKALELASASAP